MVAFFVRVDDGATGIMENVRPAMAFVLLALLAGCSHESDTDRAFTEPPPCRAGQGRAIDEAKLKRTLQRSGIHLYRDDRCEDFRDSDYAPLATLENVRNTSDYDRVVSTQGFIYCEVYPGSYRGKLLSRPELKRVKYEGDKETHLNIANVQCTIYPESPEQIDTLAAALRSIPIATRY